jgi:hypothetical protein
MFNAVQWGNQDIVKLLLEGRADPNARSDTGSTALHMAAYGGNLEALQLLLAFGGDPNIRRWDDMATPLMRAIEMFNTPRDFSGGSSVGGHRHGAVTPGEFMACIRALIAAGANIEAPNKNGRPLTLAVKMGLMEVARVLLEAGANPSVGGTPMADSDLPPLSFAMYNPGMFRLLLEHGADPDTPVTLNGDRFTVREGLERSAPRQVLEPLQKILAEKRWPKKPADGGDLRCAFCRGKGAEKLMLCTRCQLVHYCGQECQRAHWALHKTSCKKK